MKILPKPVMCMKNKPLREDLLECQRPDQERKLLKRRLCNSLIVGYGLAREIDVKMKVYPGIYLKIKVIVF